MAFKNGRAVKEIVNYAKKNIYKQFMSYLNLFKHIKLKQNHISQLLYRLHSHKLIPCIIFRSQYLKQCSLFTDNSLNKIQAGTIKIGQRLINI